MTVTDIMESTLQPEEQEAFRTLPAMIYYGCSSVEGVLMRTLNVPRSISTQLGGAFKVAETQALEGITRLEKARGWLTGIKIQVWDKASNTRNLSGKDSRNLWLILNGQEPDFG